MNMISKRRKCFRECLLERVPSSVFGEKILQLLSLQELIVLNSSILNSDVMKSWWAEVLAHAFDETIPITFCKKNHLKSLQQLGVQTQNYKNLRIELGSGIDSPNVLKIFNYFGTSIQHFELCNCIRRDQLRCIVDALAPILPNLKSLKISGIFLLTLIDASIPAEVGEKCILNRIAESCEKLEAFSILLPERICCSSKEPLLQRVRDILHVIVKNNKGLKSLDLPFFPDVLNDCSDNLTSITLNRSDMDDNALATLLSLKPQLSTLHLPDLRRAGSIELKCALMDILRIHCTARLTSIDLSDRWSAKKCCARHVTPYNNCRSYRAAVDNDCINVISSNCHQLTHLDISVGANNETAVTTLGQVTDEAIVQLSIRCRCLKKIAMRRQQITRLAVDSVIQNCLKIVCIDIAFTTLAKDYITLRGKALVEGKRSYVLHLQPSTD